MKTFFMQISRVIRDITPNRYAYFIVAVADGIINALGQGVQVLGIKLLGDIAVGQYDALSVLSAIIIVYVSGMWIFPFLASSFAEWSALMTQEKLRERIICTVFSKGKIARVFSIGEILHRYTAETEGVATVMRNFIRGNILSIVMTIAAFVFGTVIDYRLLLITLGLGIVMMLLNTALISPLYKLAGKAYEKYSDFIDTVGSMIQGVEQILLFPAQRAFLDDICRSNEELCRRTRMMKNSYAVIDCAMSVFMIIYQLAFLAIGTIMVNANLIDVSTLLASQQASGLIMGAISGISELFSLKQEDVVAVERVYELFEDCEKDKQLTHPASDADTAVRFAEVGFSYPNGPRVYEGFNCEIKKREWVQIQGVNGSGKTTFVKLLLGLCTPDSGSISTLGCSVTAEEDMEGIRRKKIGYVSQKPVLLEGSVRDNIVGFEDSIDEEYLDHLASEFGLMHLLGSTISIENDAGEDGRQTIEGMSGGEQQIISIARALYKKPSLLILDEPFAYLDAVMISRVTNFLTEYKQVNDVTVIFVNHKSNAVALTECVDRVIALGIPATATA